MKNITLPLILLLLNHQNVRISNDKDKVKIFAEEYLATLSIYMGNQLTGKEYHLTLLKMHYDTEQDYPCDLFNNEKDLDFDNYLRLIDIAYKNNIQVEYEITNLSNCEGNKNGSHFYYAFVKKILIFEGKTKNVNLLISITHNDDGFKINQVEWLNKQSIEDNNCLSDEYAKSTEKQKMEIINENRYKEYKLAGDNAFTERQYFAALENYKTAQRIKRDPYIQNQINECSSKLTCRSNFDMGNQFYHEGDYKKSIDIFIEVKNNCPDLKNDAEATIKLSREKINIQEYNYFINIGDALFRDNLYKKSKEAYLKALEFFPNDVYAKNKIKEGDEKGPYLARQEINKAIRMAESSRKKFAEAFAIMYKYESTDLLNSQNYFFMANVLDGNDDHVGKYMNFSIRTRHHLSKIYCIKSMNLGNPDAELMWYDTFNKKR